MRNKERVVRLADEILSESHRSSDFSKRGLTFFNAFTDVFTPPDDLVLTQPEYGPIARIRDGLRIREDFRKAIGNLGLE